MSLLNPTQRARSNSAIDRQAPVHNAGRSSEPAVLSDIYKEDTNIAIWRRQLSEPLQHIVSDFVDSRKQPYLSCIVTPNDARSVIRDGLGSSSFTELGEDISELVDMFCYLFDLSRAGLRLTVLRETLCPKFHVDHVPCRMVTTYLGVATEWLPHHLVNRERLGLASTGQSDQESGIYSSTDHIQSMACGDVALLKGETWQGNQDAGLVHRSPAVSPGQSRLLLTLDFGN